MNRKVFSDFLGYELVSMNKGIAVTLAVRHQEVMQGKHLAEAPCLLQGKSPGSALSGAAKLLRSPAVSLPQKDCKAITLTITRENLFTVQCGSLNNRSRCIHLQ